MTHLIMTRVYVVPSFIYLFILKTRIYSPWTTIIELQAWQHVAAFLKQSPLSQLLVVFLFF